MIGLRVFIGPGIFLLIFMFFRRRHFRRLSGSDLPSLTEVQLKQMRHLSERAFSVLLWTLLANVFLLGLFVVLSDTFNVISTKLATQLFNVLPSLVTVCGIIAAIIFDLKAQNLKKQGKIKEYGK